MALLGDDSEVSIATWDWNLGWLLTPLGTGWSDATCFDHTVIGGKNTVLAFDSAGELLAFEQTGPGVGTSSPLEGTISVGQPVLDCVALRPAPGVDPDRIALRTATSIEVWALSTSVQTAAETLLDAPGYTPRGLARIDHQGVEWVAAIADQDAGPVQLLVTAGPAPGQVLALPAGAMLGLGRCGRSGLGQPRRPRLWSRIWNRPARPAQRGRQCAVLRLERPGRRDRASTFPTVLRCIPAAATFRQPSSATSTEDRDNDILYPVMNDATLPRDVFVHLSTEIDEQAVQPRISFEASKMKPKLDAQEVQIGWGLTLTIAAVPDTTPEVQATHVEVLLFSMADLDSAPVLVEAMRYEKPNDPQPEVFVFQNLDYPAVPAEELVPEQDRPLARGARGRAPTRPDHARPACEVCT